MALRDRDRTYLDAYHHATSHARRASSRLHGTAMFLHKIRVTSNREPDSGNFQLRIETLKYYGPKS